VERHWGNLKSNCLLQYESILKINWEIRSRNARIERRNQIKMSSIHSARAGCNCRTVLIIDLWWVCTVIPLPRYKSLTRLESRRVFPISSVKSFKPQSKSSVPTTKMAPTSKPLDKKQKSLTSFFSPKSTPSSQPSQKPRLPLSSSPLRPDVNKATLSRKRPLEEDADKGNNGPEKGGEDGINLAKRQKSVGGEEVVTDTAARGGSQRTDVYLFDSSQNANVDPSRLKERELLHKKFVKRLGHPDSLSRRGGDDGGDREEEDEEGEEEEPPASKKTAKGKGKSKLTPMEIQFLDIKRKHMDAVLIVEVGYKFKFFGEDARIASKVLSIVCIPGKMRFDERMCFPF